MLLNNVIFNQNVDDINMTITFTFAISFHSAFRVANKFEFSLNSWNIQKEKNEVLHRFNYFMCCHWPFTSKNPNSFVLFQSSILHNTEFLDVLASTFPRTNPRDGSWIDRRLCRERRRNTGWCETHHRSQPASEQSS